VSGNNIRWLGAVRRTLLFSGLWAAANASAVPAADEEDLAELTELSIEQLMDLRIDDVYSASMYQQKVTRAPSSVTIVTAEKIAKFGYRTLADILRSVGGYHVSNDRNYSYLGTRGLLRPGDYNSRTLVLINGHRMNDAVYDSGYVAREAMVDVDLIERVEIIRGPSSSIYGSSAFFGVVNVITRRGGALNGTEASLEAGSFRTHQEALRYGKVFDNGVDLTLSASSYVSAGQDRLYYPEFDQRISDDPRAANDGIAVDSDDERVQNFYASAHAGNWTFSGFASSRDKLVPTASFDTTFNAGSEKTEDRRIALDLRYERALTPDIELLARAFYDHLIYHGDYPFDFAVAGAPANIVFGKDVAHGEWAGTEIQLTQKFLDRHTLLVGAVYRNNIAQDQRFHYADGSGLSELDEQHSSETLGLYAQAEFALSEQWLLNAGVRYDDYMGSFGSTVNPRLGLIFNPWSTTTFKLLYGEAFRAPNAYERFYSAVQPSHEPLKPETIDTYELVAEHYFGHRHRLQLSTYRYHADDLITQSVDANGEVYFDNRDRARAQGIELEAEGKYANGVELRASYALQKTEDAQTGQELSSSPGHLAKFNLALPVRGEELFAALELQYQGSVGTITSARADGFLIGNLNIVSRDALPGLELSAGIYNLFDKSYGYPGAEDHLQDVIKQDGRSFRIKATYRF
jgi:outer membrane receptor for ferrienterochelin and colicins